MEKESHSSRPRSAWPVALLIAMSTPARAFAESPTPVGVRPAISQAEAYAAQAFEAYGRKEYAEAVALYRMAYDAVPNADALYNIARVYDLGLRDRPLAIAAYRRLLADPGVTPDRIRVANERLRELREAELAAIEQSPEGARERALAPAPSPAGPGKPAQGSEGSAARVAAIVSGAAGVVGLGVGIGFGTLVLVDADKANASCVENRCTSRRAVRAAEAAATNATIATVGFSAGAALIAAGAVLWLGPGSSDEPDAPTRVNVSPLASTSELGLTLSGGW
jgi:tetratricopeptide (TPR) repeat protein